MTDEKLTNETGTPVEDMTPDYLAAINELKQNSVDRSKYDALKAENKKLLDSIVNGTEIALPREEKKSIEELRAAYLKEDQSNLEYITNTLKLREAIIAEGKPDPFLPVGEQIMPTDEDVRTAQKVADVLQECVDYAEGDSAVFTNELQRRLVDVKIR
jgi:vacuolar-type H+-ATPase subunit I/STV1